MHSLSKLAIRMATVMDLVRNLQDSTNLASNPSCSSRIRSSHNKQHFNRTIPTGNSLVQTYLRNNKHHNHPVYRPVHTILGLLKRNSLRKHYSHYPPALTTPSLPR